MMKKVWFFVEGDTEVCFISNLIRKKLYNTFHLEKDLLNFIEEDISASSQHAIYCENCQSVDKIPHRINEMYFQIERSGAALICIVCDVEKLKCHVTRKECIEKRLDECVDQNKIQYSFFKPMIESSYWECPQIIKKVIEIEYKKKFNQKKIPPISFAGNIPNSQFGLKQVFKDYDLKYRETLFAKEFFPRINYEKCKNTVLVRVCDFLNEI